MVIYSLWIENFIFNDFNHSFYESDNSILKSRIQNAILALLAIFVMNFNALNYGNQKTIFKKQTSL